MLTERKIRDSKPESKAVILWDRQVSGLGCKIFPTGKKSYVLSYRVGGRKRLVTLARCSEISLKDAREKAGEELLGIRDGESDPLERRREMRNAETVNDGLDRFFDEVIPERLRIGKMKPKTVHEYRLQSNRMRSAIGKRRIADVTRQEVERMVRPLKPVMRNRVLAFSSRLFNQFCAWELRDTNPCRFVEKAKEEPRDRVLNESEIAALGEALEHDAEAYPASVAAIRFDALTGLRISEVLEMKWTDIDFESGRVVLPDTKTGRRWQSLSSAALEMLTTIPRIHGNEYVFNSHATAHVTYKSVRGAFQRCADRAGLKNVRLHDLRRTIFTTAAGTGVSAHVLRDLLGHKTATMADRYIRHAGAAVADATEHMGATMAAALSGKPKGKVIPIQRGRAHG